MIVFTNIDTFGASIATVGGGATTIGDAEFLNILRKWYVPVDMGTQTTAGPGPHDWVLQYLEGLTMNQFAHVGGKAFMFAIERGHLIAYTLDYDIPEARRPAGGGEFFVLKLNPAIINDGNDMIKRLDGGEMGAGVGTSWDITDEGTVLNPFGLPVLTDPPMIADLPIDNPNKPPTPMLHLTKESS